MMRNEKEMMDLILGFAKRDDRVRAAYMNGSRANPTALQDRWRDYDIVYVVDRLDSVWQDEAWLEPVFGPRLMMQAPYSMDRIRKGPDTPFYCTFLMLLKDGNRIDLSIVAMKDVQHAYLADSLTVPLLDKDGILPPIGPPNDSTHRTKKPGEGIFLACCNEFWWCLQNVGKGLVRRELPYARNMFEQVVRLELDNMVRWWIGVQHAFLIDTGKMGKWFEQYLPAPLWAEYRQTCADISVEGQWQAIFAATALFRRLAKEVAAHLGYAYRAEDDEGMMIYLKSLYAAQDDDR